MYVCMSRFLAKLGLNLGSYTLLDLKSFQFAERFLLIF